VEAHGRALAPSFKVKFGRLGGQEPGEETLSTQEIPSGLKRRSHGQRLCE